MKFYLVLLLISLSACVSVDLKQKQIPKSDRYTLVHPEPPFVLQESNDVDYYWMNRKNGNSITVRSNCKDPLDPKLSTLERLSLQGLESCKRITRQKISFNAREALESVSQCKVDGVAVNLHLVILKKNSCNYILSYLGVSKNFPNNQKVFNMFLTGFRAK